MTGDGRSLRISVAHVVGNTSAADFVRLLYREGYLKDGELEERLASLRRLEDGGLRPKLPSVR